MRHEMSPEMLRELTDTIPQITTNIRILGIVFMTCVMLWFAYIVYNSIKRDPYKKSEVKE
jgi:hypothetical protein